MSDRYSRDGVGMRCLTLALTVVVSACGPEGGLGQNRLSTGWPQWQRIVVAEPPAAWRVEEASVTFDAWEASAVVTERSTTDVATTIRFDDGEGGVVDIRLAALPPGGPEPALAVGDDVRVSLIRQQGFEGIAQGLVVRDRDDGLLLLYDDGGYGSAFHADDARGGVGVRRALSGTGSGDDWVSHDVTFELDGETVICREGEAVILGASGLAVAVVISREWTGEPVTDVDLSPLAYLIFRVR
jgi:hypothetical protein